ncbi:bicyclomycin resistance protein [mine drainage metagenome]|uniref:Bicyclomycin resistance protein n=1 Tax=mine drainage metagenome TaxID=410659 RepID=A0A1J5S4N6_9ZZZZ
MSPATLLWLITGCMMLQPLSTDFYLASLPHLAVYFSATPAQVQQTLSLFVIGFGTAQLISGPFSDRYGRRPVLQAGLATYLIASLACALASSLQLLVVGRFVQAVGCCTAVVVARAIIRDAYTPAEGARVIAKASSLLSLVPILGPIVGGYLQVAFGWRAAFGVHALFCAILTWAAWRWLRETNVHKNPEATRLSNLARGYAQITATPAFWAYTIPGALSYGSIFVFISGSSFVLIRVLHVSTANYGYIYGLGVTGYLTGTLACRRLLPRIGIERTLSLGTSVALVGGLVFLGLVLAGVRHWALVLGCQFLTMCAHGINFPCTQAGSVAPFRQQAGAAAGLMGLFTMVAAWLAGTWVGVSFDGTLLPLALTSALLGFLLFASTRLLFRHHRA